MGSRFKSGGVHRKIPGQVVFEDSVGIRHIGIVQYTCSIGLARDDDLYRGLTHSPLLRGLVVHGVCALSTRTVDNLRMPPPVRWMINPWMTSTLPTVPTASRAARSRGRTSCGGGAHRAKSRGPCRRVDNFVDALSKGENFVDALCTSTSSTC